MIQARETMHGRKTFVIVRSDMNVETKKAETNIRGLCLSHQAELIRAVDDSEEEKPDEVGTFEDHNAVIRLWGLDAANKNATQL